MTEQEFDNLIARYETGSATDAEKALLEAWLEKRGKSDRFSRLSESEKNQIRQSLLYNIESKLERASGILPLQGESAKREGVRFTPLRIAASIAFLLIISFGAYKFYDHQRYALTEIASGSSIQKVLMTDGTIVWLKPNSSVSYPKNFRAAGNREVTLSGEALFEVAKDKTRPFIIHSRDMDTRVVGTSFNIKEVAGRSEIFVLTGKVSVTCKGTAEQVDLLPLEKAVYSKQAKQVEKEKVVDTKIAEAERSRSIEGTEYNMSFNDTRMSEVVERLAAKFNVTVTVENTSLNNCVISANLTDQSLESTLDKITKVLNAEYSVDGKSIVLKGIGCN